jgi:hypothetical protein
VRKSRLFSGRIVSQRPLDARLEAHRVFKFQRLFALDALLFPVARQIMRVAPLATEYLLYTTRKHLGDF